MRSHTHTHTHTHTANKRNNRSAPHAARMQHPPRPSKSFFAGAAGQHGKTAAPPANARPSPRVAGRTQPSIHAAGGEKSPPAHGRTDVSPSHALHSSPLDTPASTCARRLDDGRSPPPRHAQRLRPTRTPPSQQQRAPRRSPTETLQCRASTREEPGTLTQGAPVFPGWLLVPLVWESNPKLQGGWCKTQPPGR
jgi:hypothetical protein